MEYINKAEAIEILRKLIEARKKKTNCSKSAVIESNCFNYCIKIIESLEVKELES